MAFQIHLIHSIYSGGKEVCPLATQLHDGRKIDLNGSIICGMYQSLGLASQDLKNKMNLDSLQIGGPI